MSKEVFVYVICVYNNQNFIKKDFIKTVQKKIFLD